MASASTTDEPPNFITTVRMFLYLSKKKTAGLWWPAV